MCYKDCHSARREGNRDITWTGNHSTSVTGVERGRAESGRAKVLNGGEVLLPLNKESFLGLPLFQGISGEFDSSYSLVSLEPGCVVLLREEE